MVKPIVFVALGVLVLTLGLVVAGLLWVPSLQTRWAADDAYRRGLNYETVRDWEQAAAEYRQVIRLAGTYQDADRRLATVNAQRETVVVQQQAAAATAQALDSLEKRYRQGLASMESGQWLQARAEFEAIVAIDSQYRDVGDKLAEIERRLTPPTPAPTSTPAPTPTSTLTPTPAPTLSPTPTRVPPSTPVGPARWYVRLYNIDDEGTAYVNGVLVGSIRHQPGGTDSSWIEVTDKIKQGKNEFRFTLWNDYLGYTWGFQVKRGSQVVWTKEAGIENVVGADGDNKVRSRRMIYDVHVVIASDGKIVSETS